MRIAVVGGGVSGLVAAHLLARSHEVTVFEAAAHAGGHVLTVPVELGGNTHGVDLGFVVYNETTYPLFTKLLAKLDVTTHPTDTSFGFRCLRTGVEWGGRSLAAVFAQPGNILGVAKGAGPGHDGSDDSAADEGHEGEPRLGDPRPRQKEMGEEPRQRGPAGGERRPLPASVTAAKQPP